MRRKGEIGNSIFRKVLDLYIIPKREYIERKSLGQHKLVKSEILEKISDFAREDDVVVEIGGGEGNLTELIAEKSLLVISFEPDERFFEILHSKVESGVFIKGDFLMFDISDIPLFVSEFLSKETRVSETHPSSKVPKYPEYERKYRDVDVVVKGQRDKILDVLRNCSKVKIISNIPFYISSYVIHKVVLESFFLKSVHLLVQREFARKLVSKPGTELYSAISCITQFFFDVKIEFDIPPFFFRPKPEVFSSFISLYPKEKNIKKFGEDKEMIAKFIDFTYTIFRKRKRLFEGERVYKITPEGAFSLFEKYV